MSDPSRPVNVACPAPAYRQGPVDNGQVENVRVTKNEKPYPRV